MKQLFHSRLLDMRMVIANLSELGATRLVDYRRVHSLECIMGNRGKMERN